VYLAKSVIYPANECTRIGNICKAEELLKIEIAESIGKTMPMAKSGKIRTLFLVP